MSRTSISSTRKNSVRSRSDSNSKTATTSKGGERMEQRLKSSESQLGLRLAVIAALNAD
jgi:hypothetical protein